MVALADIQAYTDQIARRFKPRQIILFGSHVYGRPTDDSDVDLLVVVPDGGDDESDPQQRQITAARWLYERLIEPVESLLKGAERVLLSPDGPLHYLPFEALICGERAAENGSPFHQWVFLGERYVLSYIPSATVLKNLRDALARRSGPAGNDLIGFGDPDFEAGPQPDSDRGAGLSGITREYTDRRGLRLQRIPATGTEVREIFDLFRRNRSQADGDGPAAGQRTTGGVQRDILAVADEGESPMVDSGSPPILTAKGVQGYLRDQASKRRAIGESDDYRYVHFATHGLLDDENPL